MNGKYFITYTITACTLAFTNMVQADDLKDYYEQQMAEIAPTFHAPELGSEITITLLAGQNRTGILMKLTADDVTILTDTGSLSYKRSSLHESSRAKLFVEDFSHVKAVERTQEYKQQLHTEGIKDEQASAHEGSISVTSKVENSSKKAVESDGKKNEKTGTTITTITTTKTRTEIQKLFITIANNTTHSDTYTLAWYFYAHPLDSGKISIHDSGSERITVDARQRSVRTISSKAYNETEVAVDRQNSDYGNSPDPKIIKNGTENAGYIILLKYGETILDKKASSNTFLAPEWLEQL